MILDIRHFLKIIIHYTKFHNELTFLKDIFFLRMYTQHHSLTNVLKHF